jgi:hypothetical protein
MRMLIDDKQWRGPRGRGMRGVYGVIYRRYPGIALKTGFISFLWSLNLVLCTVEVKQLLMKHRVATLRQRL